MYVISPLTINAKFWVNEV